MSSTPPNASRSISQSSRPRPSQTSSRGHTAEKKRAKEHALEKRRQREKEWMEQRLKDVGKSEALVNISANWQSYTPFEMSLLLNPDEVTQAIEARIMRMAAIFESARNMLIIVPIMLTWLSLALAGTAYEQNLSAPKPNVKPFLQQWQEGFAPLTSVHFLWGNIALVSGSDYWFTFAHFALFDATLLAVILTLTVIGQVLEIWAYRRSTRIATLLEQHMYNLSANALFQGMENAPDAKIPPWLRELRTDLGHLGDVIDKMNIALDESMDRYTEAITQQKQAVSDLVADTNKIHDSVVQLNTLYQDGVEAARIYKRSIPNVEKNFANLVNTQLRSTQSMEGMAEMLAKSMRYLAEMTNHVRDAQKTIEHYQVAASPRPSGGRTPGYRPDQRSSHSSPPSQSPSRYPSGSSHSGTARPLDVSAIGSGHGDGNTEVVGAVTPYAQQQEWPGPENIFDQPEYSPNPQPGFWRRVVSMFTRGDR